MLETIIKFLPPTGISIKQGVSAIDAQNVTPDFKKYNIYTFTFTNSGSIILTLDDTVSTINNRSISFGFSGQKLAIGSKN